MLTLNPTYQEVLDEEREVSRENAAARLHVEDHGQPLHSPRHYWTMHHDETGRPYRCLWQEGWDEILAVEWLST